jgi:hypothetical protein
MCRNTVPEAEKDILLIAASLLNVNDAEHEV